MKLRDKLEYYRDFSRKVGLSATFRYHLLRKIARTLPRLAGDPGVWQPRLKIQGYPHPDHCRPGTSDVHVFQQIFVTKEYDCLDGEGIGGDGPILIVDCGANVGYASIFFLNKFKYEHLIAVEPDPGNFELCRRNLAPFGARATVVRSAVWSRPTGLRLRREAGAETEWGVQVVETVPDEAELQGTSIAAILDASGFAAIDLLEMDIEGAEAAVFAGDHGWLGNVRNIVIELHGADCRKTFFDAMSRYRYELSASGELTVCTNIHTS